MLEEIVKKKKQIIDQEAKIRKKKLDFIAKEFNKNKEYFEGYIQKKNITEEQAYYELVTIISSLNFNLHVEATEEKKKIKDLENTPYVKLGYYKILDGFIKGKKKLNPEMTFEHATLALTAKGIKTAEKYKRISL